MVSKCVVRHGHVQKGCGGVPYLHVCLRPPHRPSVMLGMLTVFMGVVSWVFW